MAPEAGADDETLGADTMQPGAEQTIESEPLDEFIAGTLTVVDVPAIFMLRTARKSAEANGTEQLRRQDNATDYTPFLRRLSRPRQADGSDGRCTVTRSATRAAASGRASAFIFSAIAASGSG